MSDEKIVRSHCNQCGGGTKHYVVAVREQQGCETIEEDFTIHWGNTYFLLECCGCEEISVKRTSWCSEDPPDYENVEYFPTRVSRRQPSWLEDIPEETAELMREIYGALHGDQRRLALMGARTVIDGLLFRQVGGSGTFAKRLDALEAKGFLSKIYRETLEAALNAGHAAAHRAYNPDPDNLNLVMDIVENVLQAENLRKRADKLNQTTPSRGAPGAP